MAIIQMSDNYSTVIADSFSDIKDRVDKQIDIIKRCFKKYKWKNTRKKKGEIEEIDDAISKIHELFDIAWEYNQSEESRTELSQKCTTYLTDVWQTIGAIKEEMIED